MTVIVHMSDLHVGYLQFKEDILLSTIEKINKLKPAAVVISGDLTNQGYYREYVKAKEYLDLIIPRPLLFRAIMMHVIREMMFLKTWLENVTVPLI